MSVRKADDANRRLIEALGHLYSELSGERRREGGEGTDGNVNHSSVRSAVGELEELVDRLRSAYEEHIGQVEHEHLQYKTDSEHREQSNSRLLQDCENENERLVEINQGLQQELKALQSRYKSADSSLKEKEKAVSSLMEQLGVHQEDQRRASASYESRVREVKEEVQEWRWRVRDEERERGEKNKELTQSRDMERTLRNTLEECQRQLQNTLQELHKTQQELQATETNLAATTEELTTVRHQLQPKEEELQALQEKISDRAQQLMELLDRRSGDYSRQVQEEILAQSRAYDELLKTVATQTSNGPIVEDSFSPSHTVDMATRLRDFLNPHLLTSHTPVPHTHTLTDATTSYQRYLNTFSDFTQRVRVGEFNACPKSRVRLYRLQQWRHHYKEIVLRVAPGLKMEECPLCDVISLINGVAEKLAVAPSSLLVYTVDRTRIGGANVRLWVLRRALGSTVQYEADSLLANIYLGGHRISFVSLAEPRGAPSPMEQWEVAHHRVVERLEESPMTDVMGGGVRADNLDMVDLDPAQPNSQLISGGNEMEKGCVSRRNRRVGVARRAGFHLQALMGLLCGCCSVGHGNHTTTTQYQHLEEMYSNNHSDVT